MPPQPLSSFVKGDSSSYNLGREAIRGQPDLATLVTEVIATGSYIEATWARILVLLLRAEVSIGVAMYEGIISSEAKRSALLGAAREALGADDLLLFRAADRVTKAARERRNQFAHHLWGFSELAPGCLILLNPKDDTRTYANLAAFSFAAKAGKPMKLPGLPTDKIQVYDKAALQQAAAMLEEASEIVTELYLTLGDYPGDEVRKRLSSRPAIQQAMQILSGQTSP